MSKKSKTSEEIVNEIRAACASLGWFVGMDVSDSVVSGLVIGQEQYVESVLEQLEDMDNYEIYDTAATDVRLQ